MENFEVGNEYEVDDGSNIGTYKVTGIENGFIYFKSLTGNLDAHGHNRFSQGSIFAQNSRVLTPSCRK